MRTGTRPERCKATVRVSGNVCALPRNGAVVMNADWDARHARRDWAVGFRAIMRCAPAPGRMPTPRGPRQPSRCPLARNRHRHPLPGCLRRAGLQLPHPHPRGVMRCRRGPGDQLTIIVDATVTFLFFFSFYTVLGVDGLVLLFAAAISSSTQS